MREKVLELIEEKLDQTEFFLVELNMNDEYRSIEVFVDGDDGITVDQCSKINKHINRRLEEEGVTENTYSIVVSSPGLDRPLSMNRQYKKNVGRKLSVDTREGISYTGKLAYADQEMVVLKRKKNKDSEEITLRYEDIKKAVVVI